MSRSIAATAKPLPLTQREAILRELVENSKLTERQAGLIGLREPTASEKEIGEWLARERRGERA